MKRHRRPSDELITLASYISPWEAHLAKTKLEAEGIAAFVFDEHTVGQQWFYANAVGGVKLKIARKDLFKASHILGLQQQPSSRRNTPASSVGMSEFLRRAKDILLGIGSFLLFGIPFFRKNRDKENEKDAAEEQQIHGESHTRQP